jgi:hypothetical protein
MSIVKHLMFLFVVLIASGCMLLTSPVIAEPSTILDTTVNAEAGTSSGKCSEEGFFPSYSDIKKFRRCVKNATTGQFTEYGFDCAPGTDLWCDPIKTCSFNFQCPDDYRQAWEKEAEKLLKLGLVPLP